LNHRVPLHRSLNHMILKTDLEIITGLAASQSFMGAPQVSVDLRKSDVRDFLFLQLFQGLNIIAIPFPL